MKLKDSPPKTFGRRLFAVFLVLFLAGGNAYAQNNEPFSINTSPLGAPTGPVMDYAGVLDAATKQNLERRLIEFRDKTNPKIELAAAIVRTTGERPIFEYSLAVARGWGVGAKEDDNPSALLFIAIDDRKYFTQISKDLQDELPDGLAGQLQRQYLVPAFRQGDYGKGVSDTLEAYIRTIEERGSGQTMVGQTEQAEKRQPPARQPRSGGSCNFVLCLIILFVLMLIIFSRGGRRSNRSDRDRWRGGGFGGTGSALPWIIGSAIGSSLGSGRSSDSGWGGDSSGGGDSWGGFGGGGDFDGGGAGGDW